MEAGAAEKEEEEWEEGGRRNLVRALLNKICPATHQEIIRQFIALDVSSNEKYLEHVVEAVLEATTDYSIYCPLIANLCQSQITHDLSKYRGASAFRAALFLRFERAFIDLKAIPLHTSTANEFKRRKFGAMILFGHLFNAQLISARLIKRCFAELLKTSLTRLVDGSERLICTEDIDEDSIYCGLKLMEIVGKNVENSKEFCATFLDQWIEILEKAKPFFTRRIRCFVARTVELKDNGWVVKTRD
ncbi:hypothetical protein CAEBREN_08981 [Caenorhabditis brenneri]|uniref:MIF4G domain-containing protein n=1 Tax=Caenorhabditis brenneri TaxID=135651 RepID=G0N428_CAEBE|nr:hypothetical protein CAEBREN_08981 [Caenorhabditis brenneri]